MSQDISHRFYSLVAPSQPNEWELEEVFDRLAELPEESCQRLLDHVPAVWPVSHNLCLAYLKDGAEQIESLPPELFPEWIRQLLSVYEKDGLRAARTFISDTRPNFLARHQSDSEVSLAELIQSMTLYIRGVSGRLLGIGEGGDVWTDTDTIFLPSALDQYPSRDENKLLYTYILTYQAMLVKRRFFERLIDRDVPEAVSQTITDPDTTDLLLRVFLFAEGACFIRFQLPGLWKRSESLIRSAFGSKNGGVGRILNLTLDVHESAPVLSGAPGEVWQIPLEEFERFREKHVKVELGSLNRFQRCLLGSFNMNKAEGVINQRRERDRKLFVNMLAHILPNRMADLEDGRDPARGNTSDTSDADRTAAVISEVLGQVRDQDRRYTLQLENDTVLVPDELIELASRINDDLGSIPVGYVQAASGLAGGGRTSDGGLGAGSEYEKPPPGRGHVYDEWDCRRNGYRRDWCTVLDEELPAVKSEFITRTLKRHGGLRKRLRMQFEMLRSSHRYVRRQRDGADLDLDAIIDAMGDAQAGATVGDRLFVRLQRDTRDITALFLVDMSNSTSGWISTFIKEALLLLCEAMEKVGDRYGIYGFSGMRRSRCKLYHIKTVDESYDGAVRERIGAIGPKDYTRMAPAIRHLTSILERSEARTRLLIILSDGKPEDYDGYNGDYAVEDTKKALLEARGKGVKSFCITVDKQSHDYLDHMYGAGNSIFINKIENLPAKMSQVYRILTR